MDRCPHCSSEAVLQKGTGLCQKQTESGKIQIFFVLFCLKMVKLFLNHFINVTVEYGQRARGKTVFLDSTNRLRLN